MVMLYGELCAQIAKPFKIQTKNEGRGIYSIYNLSCVCLSTLVARQTSRHPQTGRRSRTDGRLGVYSGAMPASAAQVRRSGAPDSLWPDPPEDWRPQVPVMLLRD